MVGFQRPQSAGRMRPPPKPAAAPVSHTGRAQSPAESVASARSRSPSAPPNTGLKRKEREFDHDGGEETNIHVVVRCRGRSEREVRENSGVVVSTTGVKGKNVELSMGPNAISNKTYHFDKVFSPAADQAIIYEDVVSPILGEMLAGYNCTIFAYGQTGTGKTYTMSGDMTDTLGLLSDAAGIIPRVLYSLFQKLEADQLECSVKCSFIELYNEELRDLLSPDDSVKLKIYDDASRKSHSATLVQGMEESHIKTAAAGIQLLQQGSHRRQVAATKCNDLSSRSHTVFTITAYIKKPGETGEDYISAGKLNLVDLAGSENIQRSGAENKRAAEAGLINKSLLTLGRVINALVDKSSHIPYRESKLTRLLQDSLGGRTKTCIIATVSPAKSNLEETISTLDYAFRAKNIRNKPQVNSMISKKTLLREFTAEIEKLKSELIATRQRNGVYLSNEQFEEITVESESRRILSEEQKARIETMEASLRNKVQELFSLTNNFHALKRDGEAIRCLLEGTKDVLLKTEIVLRDTQQSLAEEKAMREAHQNTEELLHGVGNDLITTVTNSVGDLGGLHAKLQRRQDLHEQNRGAWLSSRVQVVNVSDVVDVRLQELHANHSRLLAGVSSRVNGFMSAEILRLASSRDSLEKRLAEFDASEKDVVVRSSEARDSMNDVLEEIKILREDVKAKVGEGLQGLSAAAAKISGEVISELDEFHAQLHTSYAGLGRDFKSMFEEISKQLAAQKDEANQLRASLRVANRRNIEASQTASEQLQAYIESERSAARDDRIALMAQMAALLDQAATKQDDRLMTRINATSSVLAISRKEFDEADQSYDEGMNRWVEKDTLLLEKVIKSKDELKSKMKLDWTAINSRNTTIQSSTRAVHQETVKIVDAQLKEMATQMAALDEFVTRARSQNEQHHEQHVQSVNEISTGVHSNLASLRHDLDASSSALQVFGSDLEAQVTGVTDLVSPFTEDARQHMKSLRDHIEGAQLTEYTPTGETPAKKEWTYPTTLPRTETHESMIARLRGLPDPGVVAKTPSSSRTPARSPRKMGMTSPRKMQSPSKMPNPTKGRVFIDASDNKSVSSTNVSTAQTTAEGVKVGLKEMDINVLQRPASAGDHGHPDPVFSKSVGSSQPPPLKRHATEGTSKLPTKLGGRGKSVAVGTMEGRENVDVNMGGVNPLSQSLGPGSGTGHGRRLRSSPQQ